MMKINDEVRVVCDRFDEYKKYHKITELIGNITGIKINITTGEVEYMISMVIRKGEEYQHIEGLKENEVCKIYD